MVSPEDQRVTFIELFFDLVFVFAVTQTVNLFHDGITWTATGHAVLVFWLVWWAWTQFTWALNAADTTHYFVELGTMAAAIVAFFMSVALPDAFHARELWFAATYVAVRLIGLTLYALVASVNPSQRAAVQRFSVVSLSGLAAVIAGGIIGGAAQYWLWGFAILLDLIAAAVGGRQEGWGLHAEHFAERYGLFVIIALGESLIVTAIGLTGVTWTGELIAASVLAVAVTFGFWWSYFPYAKPKLDHALEERRGAEQSTMARDAFSLVHFPMVCGIIAFAAAVEEALAHPSDPLPAEARAALAVGLALFVGGMAVAIWRATGRRLVHRTILIAVTAVLVGVVSGTVPAITLGIGFAGIVLAIATEHWLIRNERVSAGIEIESEQREPRLD
jgi:low temperature requirement protein LtrA